MHIRILYVDQYNMYCILDTFMQALSLIFAKPELYTCSFVRYVHAYIDTILATICIHKFWCNKFVHVTFMLLIYVSLLFIRCQFTNYMISSQFCVFIHGHVIP